MYFSVTVPPKPLRNHDVPASSVEQVVVKTSEKHFSVRFSDARKCLLSRKPRRLLTTLRAAGRRGDWVTGASGVKGVTGVTGQLGPIGVPGVTGVTGASSTVPGRLE